MPDKIRVLHLEDNARDAQFIRDLFEAGGLNCDFRNAATRETYEAALEEGWYDIILCDNSLPNYDGFSALKLAREKRPLTPFVIISGAIGEEEAVRSLQYGATDYLLKARLERLVPAVKRALEEAREKGELKDAEEKLRRNEERMRLALAATDDAVWDWNLTNDRIDGNDAFEKLLGKPPAPGQVREWWYERIHPEDRERVEATLTAAMVNRQEFWTGNYRFRRSNGQWAHIHNRACLAPDESGAITRLVGAIQDVTRHIEAESERRGLEEQLRHAQKMEAIGTLAGGIAHDFNNILGVILSNAELIKTDIPVNLPADSEITESVDEILMATARARDLVRQILTFSRRTESERILIKPQPIVSECLKLLRSTIPAMVTITERIDPACSCILCDPTQLHQIVMNLCTNAWHALPDRNGTLEVRVDEVDAREVPDEHDANDKSPRYVRISVTDNGHGMPPEVQARIFEPFYTTKPHGEGTGLGLAVVHGIVKSHNGIIGVTSDDNHGTTVDIFFPAQTSEVELPVEPDTKVFRGAGEKILLVDDNVAFARGMERVLKQQGYHVRVCHSPRVALDLFRKEPAAFDLLITDLSMPRMSGTDLASHVSTIRPGMPILLITGSFAYDEKQQARISGCCELLAKPVAPRVLSETVSRMITTSRKEPNQ